MHTFVEKRLSAQAPTASPQCTYLKKFKKKNTGLCKELVNTDFTLSTYLYYYHQLQNECMQEPHS